MADQLSGVPDLRLWGKWGDQGSERYPLLAHLVDTACVAEVLFEFWLPERLVTRLDQVLGGGVGTARRTVTAGAGLHDVGKLNPYFQGQLLGRRAGEFAEQTELLREGGYWVPSGWQLAPSAGQERELVGRHEVVSSVLLRESLDADPESFACMVAGHHGRWRKFGELEYDDGQFPVACGFYEALRNDPLWTEQASAHRDAVLDVFGLGHDETAREFDRAGVPILTSLVCLADWVASSEESVAEGRTHEDLLGEHVGEFRATRRRFFVDHVRDLLGTPRIPTGSFNEVFGFAPTRPVQQDVVAESAPGLTVVMVPMGEGKTEAALGRWMLSAEAKQGIYFALPTMATADAMFGRVENFFAHTEDPVLASLAHGRAVLNSFYQPSRGDTRILSSADGSQGGLTPQDWFTGRHRALLAPVSVGTVDQLLAGALRHRYNFLRLLGAATKTVILDEVHTYDPYMSELLCGFLEWAGWLNTDVVLLSATLPARRLSEYVDAYRRGAGFDKEGLPVGGACYPSVVRVVGGAVEQSDLSALISGREVTLGLEWAAVPEDQVPWQTACDTVRELLDTYPEAKLGVIMNTVAGAQNVAGTLAEDGYTPAVLHARMPAFERAERTEAAIADFGKVSGPGSSLLVATQIVEASIDLDFDILITEVCPAASLLQRAGRVWRHDLDEPDRSRRRPEGLVGPLVVVVRPDPLPTGTKAFLPYQTAEIMKTVQALGNGTATQVTIPTDVQRLVDAADVTFADLEAMGAVAEDAVVAGEVKRLRGKDAAIPRPAAVSKRLKYLMDYSQGELGDEEWATRLSDLPTMTILPVASTSRLAWAGALPARPSRYQVLDIISYTVPISGALVRKIYAELAAQNPAFRTDVFTHRLLADVVVVDLDKTTIMSLDDLLGLCKS